MLDAMRKEAVACFTNARVGFAAIDFFMRARSHFHLVFSDCLVAAAELDAAESTPAFAEKFSPELHPAAKAFLDGRATDAEIGALFAELMA